MRESSEPAPLSNILCAPKTQPVVLSLNDETPTRSQVFQCAPVYAASGVFSLLTQNDRFLLHGEQAIVQWMQCNPSLQSSPPRYAKARSPTCCFEKGGTCEYTTSQCALVESDSSRRRLDLFWQSSSMPVILLGRISRLPLPYPSL